MQGCSVLYQLALEKRSASTKHFVRATCRSPLRAAGHFVRAVGHFVRATCRSPLQKAAISQIGKINVEIDDRAYDVGIRQPFERIPVIEPRRDNRLIIGKTRLMKHG
uniref:Uncharacterized protein n=1 Tax=Candidatus Kentrum sp. FW TaxID=2126338 RepID=A0A450SBB0_9GAMM|nr:MAG: hypothetical protein BECKFW1821A_GA0114235_10238 [Candidatus Kentron sp. FW]VFJ56495.1 MAG: hypothetical protein BECKFW1821B_GA0114236_10282 [Candidatus Kentron sp. FW]